MSPAGPMVPRSAWVAAGAAITAGWVAFGGSPMAALVLGLVALATGLALDRAPAGSTPGRAASMRGGADGLAGHAARMRGPLVAAAVGTVAIAVRVALSPAAAPVPPLPDDRGPWPALVESVGSPRDGSQVARLALLVEPGPVRVAATLPAFPAVRSGDTVEVAGRLRPPPDDDPYAEYLRRTGAAGSLDATQVTVLAPASGIALQPARDAAGDALRVALPEPEAGLAAGILVGLRERVDRSLAADFATAGASHVVAISGWNIAIVASLVGAVMRGRPRRVVAIVVGGTIVAYVVAAGASPSVVRAAVMAAVVLLARESGRAGRAPAALALAAFAMLVVDPAMIGDAGFRLSVAATAGLLAWATPLGRWIGDLGGGRVPGWLAEGLGISLAAQAATLPDVLVTFGRLSLVSPAVNLAVVPLVPAAMAAGVLALGGGALAMLGLPGIVATIAGLPAWLLLHLIVGVVRLAASLPFAALAIPPEAALPMALVAGALVLVAPSLVRRGRARRARRRSRAGGRRAGPSGAGPAGANPRPAAGMAAGAARPATGTARAAARGPARASPIPRSAAGRLLLGIAVIAIAVSTLALADVAGRSTRLVALDVGQGDAILVESRDGARMLVDGGPDPDRLLVELDAQVPAWDRRIDLVVLTHPHEDHVAGLVRVLERYRVGRVFEPGMRGGGPGWAAWDSALRHGGPPRAALAAGARLRLGEIGLTVLWPEPGVPRETASTGRGINDTSIVLLGEANGRRFLLTGDAEDDVDPALLAGGLPRVDILKVAHHGSATASSAALLEALHPSLALISVGAGNDYGHPAPSTLDRLRAAGARVLRTDLEGTIDVELRADGLRVRTSGARGAAAGALTAWAAHERGEPADRGLPPGPRGARRATDRLRMPGGRRRPVAPSASDRRGPARRVPRRRRAARRRARAPARGGAQPRPGRSPP